MRWRNTELSWGTRLGGSLAGDKGVWLIPDPPIPSVRLRVSSLEALHLAVVKILGQCRSLQIYLKNPAKHLTRLNREALQSRVDV